ncbi:MAG: RNA-directed DNA polymerase [Actinomycetota bacterium]
MSRRPTPSRPALSRPIRWELSLKPDGGTRKLARLEGSDELRFARAVARAAPHVRRALGEGSHANRVLDWDPEDGLILEPWRPARRRWIRHASRLARDARWVAITDVRDCYPSITMAAVGARLRTIGAPVAAVDEIGSWLRAFAGEGVDGLPIGPPASAVLADAVLSMGDRAIGLTGVWHLRWVDDVAIFAPDRRTALRSLDALRKSLSVVGLELHDAKTKVFSDPRAVAAHLRSRPSSPGAFPRCDNRPR